MDLAAFLQDLAMIMIVAGIVTIICHQLRQPVVLGYILAGIILGPHTPPFALIQDISAVKTLAELGVIFLMFSLGLEFNLRKLFRVGNVAIIAATAEIIFMILVGYEIGQFFKWRSIDSLFLGAMLAISSTTIILKAFDELKLKKKDFAQLVFGILIVEDILAIAILTLLSSIAIQGEINTSEIILTLVKLLVFLVASMVLGIYFVPRILSYVAQFKNKEMLLITVLGLCFGFSLLVIRLNYSVALGAFLIGAIMAESHEIKLIEKLVQSLTDMFSAIFFVSIGLLVNPHTVVTYLLPIFVITASVVVGKVLVCSLGTFLAGRDGETSLKVGMSLAQIGEFSFIIAALGMSLKVTSDFLYPIIVAVSIITTLLTPYLIKSASLVTRYFIKIIPKPILNVFSMYRTWLESIQPQQKQATLMQIFKKGLLQILINLALIIAIFVIGAFLSRSMKYRFIENLDIQKALVWGTSLIISLPFLVAIYRKIQGLSMILAELSVNNTKADEYNLTLRKAISQIIPMASILGIILMLIALSASILPPFSFLILVFILAIGITFIFWKWIIKLHSHLQINFIKQLDK